MSTFRRAPPPNTLYPNVIGTPGGSLSGLGGKFGHEQVSAGFDGEIRTARALANLCVPGGPTVLHDLVLPMSRITANIDHIIISGKEVRIFDSKTWTPGFYWTFAGHTRRGFTRCEHADTRTMSMAIIAINKVLSNTGVRFVMKRPVLIVWPSNTKKRTLLHLFRPTDARAVTGGRFAARPRHYAGTKPANQQLVAALVPLVIALRHQNQRTLTPTQQAPFAIPTATFLPGPEFLPEPTLPTKVKYASDDF